MAELPMLFTGPMIKALLAGRKTQTRRSPKPRKKDGVMPMHAIGDRLWVRETLRYDWKVGLWFYAADGDYGLHGALETPTPKRWPLGVCSSIFMPRWASRFTLTVTDVRLQRVQDIDEADAIAEGLEWVAPTYGVSGIAASWCEYPRSSYCALWDSINGAGSWNTNPWVAAYTFTVERT